MSTGVTNHSGLRTFPHPAPQCHLSLPGFVSVTAPLLSRNERQDMSNSTRPAKSPVAKSPVNANESTPTKTGPSKAGSSKPSGAHPPATQPKFKTTPKTKSESKHDVAIGDRHKSSCPTKADEVIAMLRTKQGASIDKIAGALGWQRHSVHGLISGTLRKRQGVTIVNELVDGVRMYRIAK